MLVTRSRMPRKPRRKDAPEPYFRVFYFDQDVQGPTALSWRVQEFSGSYLQRIAHYIEVFAGPRLMARSLLGGVGPLAMKSDRKSSFE